MPGKSLAIVKPLFLNKASPLELSARRLSGFDVLTSKCLTFLFFFLNGYVIAEDFSHAASVSSHKLKLFDLGFVEPWVKFNQWPAIVPRGNGWTVCLMCLVIVRIKALFFK